MTRYHTDSVRIIAGLWRGRRLSFPADLGIRPSGDRVRVTLFNWLHAYLADARCLDAFAGSGALGFEALSRGAREVFFVDRSTAVITHLKNEATHLQATGAEFLTLHLPTNTCPITGSFDLVFLDPPFEKDLWEPMITWLTQHQLVTLGSLIYIERPRKTKVSVPEHWSLWKTSIAGNIAFELYRCES